MNDATLGEMIFKCPLCQKEFKGEHVNNPYECQGICDWCALGLMLKEPSVKELVESN